MGRKTENSHKESASLVEAFVYKLGNVLGGRREVIATPAIELLHYTHLEMTKAEEEAEREKARIYFNYIANLLSHPPQGKEDSKRIEARKEFEETFKPKNKEDNAPKVYEWDEELMKRLKKRQEGG